MPNVSPKPTSTPSASPPPFDDRPLIRLKPGAERRLRGGHPWVYANEIAADAQSRALPPGALARIEDAQGRSLGLAGFNPHALIAGRMLSPDPDAALDAGFFQTRLDRAARLRAAFYPDPFFRLIHAEADGLPGVVVDRFGDAINLQINAAWANRAQDALVAAVEAACAPAAIVLRNDSDARGQEGLDVSVEVVRGAVDGPVTLMENGARFSCDLRAGQKTGWFYDQRENRAHFATLATGRDTLDMYSYAGGFGVLAALRGARAVTLVDRSTHALARAAEAAEANGVADRVTGERSEAFRFLEQAAEAGRLWGAVVCDPPAFAKTRKDAPGAQKAYRKLARLAARVVAPEGWLLLASCSHHVDEESFIRACGRGLAESGRRARLVRVAGAGPDHPRHPFLAESAYLKALTYAFD